MKKLFICPVSEILCPKLFVQQINIQLYICTSLKGTQPRITITSSLVNPQGQDIADQLEDRSINLVLNENRLKYHLAAAAHEPQSYGRSHWTPEIKQTAW